MNRVSALALVFAVGCNAGNGAGPGGGDDGGVGGGGAGQDAGGGGNPALATAKLGTYIALGDSISDHGGTGPYFYDLLLQNDDATYPDFKGKDLKSKYDGITYVHGAVAGSITDSYSDLSGAPTLKAQVAALGHSYPGDVLVTITIGGNDLNGHAQAAISGTDQAIQAEFTKHLADELGELAKPGRLGSGKVYLVLANIYDFTDGKGNFRTVNCGPPINVQPARDMASFSAWNGIAAQAIMAVTNGTLYDMHANFTGHGFNNPNPAEVWFDSASCIHPNAKGHDAIRRSIYSLVTGG